jgi:hypothetical protein
MDDQTAKMLLTAVRRAGDSMVGALAQLKQQLPAEEYERWQYAVGAAMGSMYGNLVGPLCDEHPAIVPKTLGGPADD